MPTIYCTLYIVHEVRVGHTRTDDSHNLGDGFGSDGMVSCHHDDLDASRAALCHGIWYVGTRRINQGHQSNETEVFGRKVWVICIKRIPPGELLVIQDLVSKPIDMIRNAEEVLSAFSQDDDIQVMHMYVHCIEETSQTIGLLQSLPNYIYVLVLRCRNLAGTQTLCSMHASKHDVTA